MGKRKETKITLNKKQKLIIMKKLFIITGILITLLLSVSCTEEEPINPIVNPVEQKYDWDTWCIQENIAVDSLDPEFYDTIYFQTFYDMTQTQIDSTKQYWDNFWDLPAGNPDCFLLYKKIEY